MDIQFEEENFNSKYQRNGFINSEVKKASSKIANMLINNGLAKNESSANVIMTTAALAFFVLSIYFFIFGFNLPQRQQATPVQNPAIPGLER